MLHRKRMPPDLEPAWRRFRGQAQRVEQARAALLSCLPVGRIDPAPIPVGLDLLHDELRAVAASLHDWRHPAVASAWSACEASIDEALSQLPQAHGIAVATTELETLLTAVAAVVEPLDAWADAERAWLRLRSRDAAAPSRTGP